ARRPRAGCPKPGAPSRVPQAGWPKPGGPHGAARAGSPKPGERSAAGTPTPGERPAAAPPPPGERSAAVTRPCARPRRRPDLVPGPDTGMMDGMSRPRPRPVSPSPPVDFPLYGLDASWAGSRWLELFGEAIGDPVHWVAL